MPQRLSPVPLDQLVRETREWNGGHGIDLLSWVGCVGDIRHAVAFGELFWPEFVEYDGCVFRNPVEEPKYRSWMAATGGDRRAVEAVMNHLHVTDVFRGGGGAEPTREQVMYLGRLLREMWEAKARRDFPGRPVVVVFDEPDNPEALEDYQLVVYQDREGR